MATRTAFAGTATNTTLTAANLNNLPGGWIGYVAATSSSSTFTGSAISIVSVSPTAGSSRRLKITAQGVYQSDVASDDIEVTIEEDGTQIQLKKLGISRASTGYGIVLEVISTPSSGAHTYAMLARRSAGTGNGQSVPAADAPAFILVEDIGPA